jgi:hypothetical protein
LSTTPSSHFSQEGEADSTPSAFNPSAATGNSLVPAIYNEDPLDEPQPDRVHIRGLDDFHTSDIITFASDHFPDHDPAHIQWIDDTSANIVYSSAAIAQEALLSFSQTPITAEDVSIAPFQLRPAKPHFTRPASTLQVRVAKIGDRKKKGAKDASRYYLLHPDQDPRERMRKEFEANGRIRRGGDRGDHGDYQRRRYDDREHRRRRDNDAANGGDTNGDFSASMYDDAPAAVEGAESSVARGRDLFARTNSRRHRNRSASPGRSATKSDSLNASDDDGDAQNRRRAHNSRFRDRSPPPRYTKRDPHPFPANNASKELFPTSEDKSTKTNGEGTLRSDKIELFPTTTSRNDANNATARRMKADLLSSPRSQTHRRSNAMDAANDEDLAERFGRKSLAEHAKSRNANKELLNTGLNIRGAAMDQGLSIKGSGGLSIKGAAANTRELFPSLYQKGDNEGKELFSDKIRERGRRIRADDFH